MPTILGANTLSTGYDVANSLRFDDGSSAYLNRTPSSASNRTTWTWSAWIKRSNLTGGQMALFGAKADSSNDTGIWLQSDDTLQFFNNVSGTVKQIRTNRLFRDSTAWYHIVAVWDSDNGTAGNRMRLYINGVEETSFGTDTNPGSGDNSTINNTEVHQIGRVDTTYYFDGYMAEVCFIDGQALDATSFGEFDEDSPTQWKPKKVSTLTFGTNGFYLEFKQSGTSQNSSGMGADTSGNDNHFAVNNLTALDQSKDTCTNNFATLNNRVNSYSTEVALTEGNLKATHPGVWGGVPATIGVQNGRWYWECKVTTGNAANAFTGIAAEDVDYLDATVYDETGLLLYFVDGRKTVDGSNSEGFFDSLATDDIVGVHLDLESGTKTCTFTKNGSTSGSAVNLTANHTGKFVLPVSIGNSSSATANWEFNFGSPSYSISSGNADDNGHGNFEYPPNISSTSYYALCTKNLAEHG